jgi:hypothetical protein
VVRLELVYIETSTKSKSTTQDSARRQIPPGYGPWSNIGGAPRSEPWGIQTSIKPVLRGFSPFEVYFIEDAQLNFGDASRSKLRGIQIKNKQKVYLEFN